MNAFVCFIVWSIEIPIRASSILELNPRNALTNVIFEIVLPAYATLIFQAIGNKTFMELSDSFASYFALQEIQIVTHFTFPFFSQRELAIINGDVSTVLVLREKIRKLACLTGIGNPRANCARPMRVNCNTLPFFLAVKH